MVLWKATEPRTRSWIPCSKKYHYIVAVEIVLVKFAPLNSTTMMAVPLAIMLCWSLHLGFTTTKDGQQWLGLIQGV